MHAGTGAKLVVLSRARERKKGQFSKNRKNFQTRISRDAQHRDILRNLNPEFEAP